MEDRQRRVVCALGAPGQGKTALCIRLIDRYPASAGTVRALDPAGQLEWGEWPGRGKALKEWLAELKGEDLDGRPLADAPGKHRGLLLLDDCDRYVSHTSYVGDGWNDLWLANRHYQLDIIATAHRPQHIPKDMIGSSHEVWLFQQAEARAVDYLREIRGLETVDFPDRPGLAVRVQLLGTSGGRSEPQLVKLF